MELAVPSFVFTPGRIFRERTALGPLDCRIRANPVRPISLRHIAESNSRALDMQTIKQLQRFYVDEVFRPQPPIPGSQGSETVSLSCETSAFDQGEYTTQIQRVFVEGSSPSTHTRSRFTLHPTPRGVDGVSIEGEDEALAGEEVLIEDQNRPVAKIIPFNAEDEDEEFDERLAKLIAEGKARAPIGPLAPEFWTEPPIKVSGKELVALVSEDRDED